MFLHSLCTNSSWHSKGLSLEQEYARAFRNRDAIVILLLVNRTSACLKTFWFDQCFIGEIALKIPIYAYVSE